MATHCPIRARLIRRERTIYRVVGVRHGDAREHHWYVTNVPVTVLTPTEIANTYAARWEIELVFRELKTHPFELLLPDPAGAPQVDAMYPRVVHGMRATNCDNSPLVLAHRDVPIRVPWKLCLGWRHVRTMRSPEYRGVNPQR